MENAERIRMVLEMTGRGETVASACRAAGISRKTYYKWHGRLVREAGDAGAAPSPGVPADPDWKAAVLSLCLRHPDWGCDRISYYLHLQGVEVSSPTVQKHLIRHGLGRAQQRKARARYLTTGPAADPLHPDGEANYLLRD